VSKITVVPWSHLSAPVKRPEPLSTVALRSIVSDRAFLASAVTLGALTVYLDADPAAVPAFAASTIIHAFDPIIRLVQALSYPVAFLSISGGILLITVGQRHKGIAMIKWGSVGYIAMQLVPGLMAMLADVGQSMRQ
jgi:hypothetical protein